MTKRSRLKKDTSKNRKKRLPVIKKPIYYLEWEKKYGKSPIGFIGKLKSYPPLMKTKESQMVIINWKTRVVRDVWGRPIGTVPTKQRLDKFCPEKEVVEV